MQSQLNDYLKENIKNCDFSQFEQQGFVISLGNPVFNSKINNDSIELKVNQDVFIKHGNVSWTESSHNVLTNSNLGKFYNLAKDIYSNEKQSMFLENYGVDVLRLYAPVDGSDISCSSKIWNVLDVRNNLTVALESNVPEIKVKGSYYRLNSEVNKYFVKDIGENVDSNVNFMFSRSWPMKLEVWPSEDGIMKADPVGLEQGMAMLGFCYVPYHFVYDLAYPVLIQVYSGSEMFQFPVVVYINKNQPRVPVDGESLENVVPDLCQYKLANLTVSTFDKYFNPVAADIQFKCFDTTCDIGNTTNVNNQSILSAAFPQCVNGYVIAKANGYSTKKYLASGNESNIIIFLDKQYDLNLSVLKNGKEVDNMALITFSNNDSTITINYPSEKKVSLTAGQYQIKVYTYSNGSITLRGNSTQKCVDVPRSGILGMIGSTEQKCFTITNPDQTIDQVISGGGTQNYYVSDSQLDSAKKLIINAPGFPMPKAVGDLQQNFNSVDVTGLDVQFE